MGYTSHWDDDVYTRVTGSKISRGATFSYTDDVNSGRAHGAHPTLAVVKAGKPTIREARDSENHPNSTPIVIGFDETGSMGENPELLQKNLKELFGMLQRKDYVEDPQIAMAAYGDAYCDSVPIQMGQFESGNEIDDELDNIYIEGMGGGNGGETSTLLVKYVADNTETDAWDKRHKKGYLFLVGDERALPLRASQTKTFLSDPQPTNETAEDVFKRVQERWNVYMLLIDNWSAKDQRSYEQYSSLLDPEHVIKIKNGSLAAATIASIIGACEETADLDSVRTDLVDAGFSDSTALAVVDSTKNLYRANGESKAVAVDDSYGDLDF